MWHLLTKTSCGSSLWYLTVKNRHNSGFRPGKFWSFSCFISNFTNQVEPLHSNRLQRSGGLGPCSQRQRRLPQKCCRLAAPHAGLDSLFSSLRLFHHLVVVLVVLPVIVESVCADCLSQWRAASRSKESINDERRMQAPMSLSQRRVDRSQQPLTRHHCLLLFPLQRLEGEEGEEGEEGRDFGFVSVICF